GLIGHCLGLDQRQEDKKLPQKGMQRNGLLQAAFQCGPTFWQGRLTELAMPQLRRMWFRRTFSPRTFTLGDGNSHEEFDEAIFHQQPGTWLAGWFQSDRYFAANSERVRAWFRPRPEIERQLNERMAEWPEPPEGMAAVHVRRGDYAIVRDSVSDGDRGWLLPI